MGFLYKQRAEANLMLFKNTRSFIEAITPHGPGKTEVNVNDAHQWAAQWSNICLMILRFKGSNPGGILERADVPQGPMFTVVTY
jgi:hypothetical protein